MNNQKDGESPRPIEVPIPDQAPEIPKPGELPDVNANFKEK